MRRWFEGGTPRLWAAVVGVSLTATTVLGVLAARGSWYTDDLDFLIHGSRGFSPDSLLTPVNDHVVPGLRAAYALFAAVAPLDYRFTVLVRCVVWCAACLTMAALLQRLFAKPVLTCAGTAFYALAPMAMPSFMSLSSAVNNLPTHLLGLVFLHCTVDWFDRRERLSLFIGGMAVFGSLLFWEKSILIVATGAALVLARYPLTGTKRAVSAWIVSWALPLVAFAAIFVSRRQSGNGHLLDISTLGNLFVKSIERSVLPSLVGGPWSWSATNPPYFGFADPPGWVVAIGAVCVAIGLAVCLVRAPRTAWLWAAVLVYAVGTVLLVSFGRYAAFGDTLTAHYHYWSDAAIPVTLALVGTMASLRRPRSSVVRILCVSLVSGWLVVCAVSLAGFAHLWSRNPAGEYVTTLQGQLAGRRQANLWDTVMPADIVPVINTHRDVAGLVRLMHTDAQIQAPISEPSMVDGQGSLRPATFQSWARGTVPKNCGFLLKGVGSVRIPLSTKVPKGDWFVRIAYLSSPASRVSASLDDGGFATPLRAGAPIWPAGLTNAYLRADTTAAADAVTLTSRDERTNLCVGSVDVGVPQVAP